MSVEDGVVESVRAMDAPAAPPSVPGPAPGSESEPGVQDRSPYLVSRLLHTRNENLFNHVKFSLVKDVIDELGLACPRVLDIGCGLQVADKYLSRLGLESAYFGVDYEPRFNPDAVVDLLHLQGLERWLPWQPDVILALDVLEHLHEEPAVLRGVIEQLAALACAGTTVIVTLPQMYRLDRMKLAHLHYPEHRIRLTRQEWRSLLEHGFRIDEERGLGYLSVLPYLPMASRRYRPDNGLGRLFTRLREHTVEWAPLKPADLWLSRTLGRVGAFKGLSNDVLFVASSLRTG